MKTITEFAAQTLKNASKTHQDLTTAGKTTEELPAAMGEALKLEGDKLTLLMSALEAVGTKTGDLKRVVVLTLAEGEKAPTQAKQIGEHYFMNEYYPPIHKPGQPGKQGQGKDHGGRGEKRGDKKGKRGGDGGRGRDGERGARGPGGGPGSGGERSDRGPRRGPPPAGFVGPQDGQPAKKIVITPVAKPAAPKPAES